MMKIFSRTEPHTEHVEIIHDPDWGSISYEYSNRRRRTKIAVEPFTGLKVYLAKGATPRSATKLIDQHQAWIYQAIQRNQSIQSRSKAFFKDRHILSRNEVRSMLEFRLNTLSSIHHFEYAKLTIRNQRSRWGSCSAQNNISLNQKLQFLPSELKDYILIHELAHTRQKNHGPQFWKILHNIFGREQTYSLRNQLRDFEFLFHPPPNNI